MKDQEEKIKRFKDAFEKFKEAMIYIRKNLEALQKDPPRLARIRKNFEDKFERPLNEAWDALDHDSKNRFATLYFLRREGADADIEYVKELAKFFGGTITHIWLKSPAEIAKIEAEKGRTALVGSKHGPQAGLEAGDESAGGKLPLPLENGPDVPGRAPKG